MDTLRADNVRLRRLLQLSEEQGKPLFVYGTGGVGKSTLLSHFILDNVDRQGLRTVYIDIDRPTIRPDKPPTILLEAVTQLSVQLDVIPKMVESLSAEISHGLLRREQSRLYESRSGSEYHWQLAQFGKVLQPLFGSGTLLIVVDTFEEAQFLGADFVWPFLNFLFDFARAMPNLRLILSGRTLPPEFLPLAFQGTPVVFDADGMATETTSVNYPNEPERPINLDVLDAPGARKLLEKATERAGVRPLRREELDDIIGIVSRNPMCIKLAARLLRDEGIGQLRSYPSEFLTKLRAEKIQALLYGRILHHLHTSDIHTIAMPGLIVRRITPEIIREVLAEPCGLKLTPQRDENYYFEALGREAALVNIDPLDGSLRHRVDVRRAMLEDLTDHVPIYLIDQIDTAAIDFYSSHDDPISRAEEIYHRLRRREPQAVLDSRWIPEAAEHLRTAGQELPAQQRLWLANKLGVTVDDSIRQTAGQEAWEQQVAQSAERYLAARSPGSALKAMHERPTRLPRSKLFLLEAEAYRFLDQPEAALKVARTGIDSARKAGATDLVLELLLQMVAIEEARGELESAAALLGEACVVANHSTNDVLRFRVSVNELRLRRQLHPDDSDEHAERRHEVLADVTGELWQAVRRRPVLLRETAAELGADDPQIASAAIETLGVEVASDGQAQALGQAIAALSDSRLSGVTLGRTIVKGAELFEDNGFDVDGIRNWATETMSSKDIRSLGTTLASIEPGSPLLNNFVDYFRAGVDNSFHAPIGLQDF